MKYPKIQQKLLYQKKHTFSVGFMPRLKEIGQSVSVTAKSLVEGGYRVGQMLNELRFNLSDMSASRRYERYSMDPTETPLNRSRFLTIAAEFAEDSGRIVRAQRLRTKADKVLQDVKRE